MSAPDVVTVVLRQVEACPWGGGGEGVTWTLRTEYHEGTSFAALTVASSFDPATKRSQGHGVGEWSGWHWRQGLSSLPARIRELGAHYTYRAQDERCSRIYVTILGNGDVGIEEKTQHIE